MLVSSRAGVAFAQQGTAVLTGTVVDASTKKPIPDVVVTVTSPSLQGWQTVVTDSSGVYRVPSLPPGTYNVGLDKEAYKPYARGGIDLRADTTIRLNAEMLPEALKGEEVVVVGQAPTVDVGSSTTGQNINADFARRVPIAPPGAKGSAARSFEAVAAVAPGAHTDTYGTSINGTTSPENQYVVDGVSVNDPAYAIIGTPLSIEFVKEVNVISGGYMPEYGRATGGVLDVVTKTGSNEFHGNVWTYFTPGSFEGPRTKVRREAQTITIDPKLSYISDFGAELEGPILKDKLWFAAGVDFNSTRYRLTRKLNRIQLDANNNPVVDPDTGFTQSEELPGTARDYYAVEHQIQYFGKLTYLFNQDHNVSLAVYGTPTWAGGSGNWAMDPQQGVPETDQLDPLGNPAAVQHHDISTSNDVSLKWSSAFDNKRWLLDAFLGWHHARNATLPGDGSDLGSDNGLAGISRVSYRRNRADHGGYHPITDFESVPDPALCRVPASAGHGTGSLDPTQAPDPNDPTGQKMIWVPGPTQTLCPVRTYQYGGPDFIDDATLNRYQGKAVLTRLLQGAGHHVIKGGLDIELMNYDHAKTYSGGRRYRESTSGTTYSDHRQYGYLDAPDHAVFNNPQEASTKSTTLGGFVQDSWSIMDKITLNVGLRYDAQMIFGDDDKLGLTLPNQWSPRVGLVYDFTQQGKSKLFTNYAVYYESVPLDMADRSFPGERQLFAIHDGSTCDPRDLNQQRGSCQAPGNRLPINSPSDPNQQYLITGGDKVPVDPNIKPQSSSEFVLGGEYEVIPQGRAGLVYTKRWMNNIIEDMSRDEGQTYFIGNPGQGIASDFPQAKRNYDAVTLYFDKRFADEWLASASYTVSYLRGNWAGLFRPETTQLDPNINSDFDLISLLPNRDGALPGDQTHQIKLFGAKDFTLPGSTLLELGLGYRGASGGPTNYLGSHAVYGSDEVYILPRGSGDRLPWVHSIDAKLQVGFKINKDSSLVLSMDIFNLFNFQAVTSVDETYTSSDVLPIDGGAKTDVCAPKAGPSCATKLKNQDGTPFDNAAINPNFGHPTEYQLPRRFRFGARITF